MKQASDRREHDKKIFGRKINPHSMSAILST